MFNVHITRKSSNAKTGPIPVTTSAMETCPSTCPLNTANSGGCYANGGPLRLHWKKVSEGERGGNWTDLVQFVSNLPQGQLWRHNQAGDLPHFHEYIDAESVMELARANEGARGFTYTHHDIGKPHNRKVVEIATDRGFTINVSANNPTEAARFKGMTHAPVVSVVSEDFWQGKNKREFEGEHFVRCPAEYKDGVNCANCGACASSSRVSVIGFTAHGTQKKKAAIIARG